MHSADTIFTKKQCAPNDNTHTHPTSRSGKNQTDSRDASRKRPPPAPSAVASYSASSVEDKDDALFRPAQTDHARTCKRHYRAGNRPPVGCLAGKSPSRPKVPKPSHEEQNRGKKKNTKTEPTRSKLSQKHQIRATDTISESTKFATRPSPITPLVNVMPKTTRET